MLHLDPFSLLALTALSLAAVLGAGVRSEPLEVMTFNIRYGTANDGANAWSLRKPRALAALRAHPAQVIGMQEVLQGQIDDLTRAFPQYEALGVGREDGRRGGEFSAILYDRTRLQALRSDTFWLSDTPTVPGSRTWGNGNVRICTWAYFRDRKSGRFFYHFNTHIDHLSQPSREKSVALILRRIAERSTDDPVIVTGDFNVGETNPVVASMTSGGFRDTYRVLHPNETTVGTFNGFEPEFGKEKIDYIFVDQAFGVTRAELVREKFEGGWPSDHAPVVAQLVF